MFWHPVTPMLTEATTTPVKKHRRLVSKNVVSKFTLRLPADRLIFLDFIRWTSMSIDALALFAPNWREDQIGWENRDLTKLPSM